MERTGLCALEGPGEGRERSERSEPSSGKEQLGPRTEEFKTGGQGCLQMLLKIWGCRGPTGALCTHGEPCASALSPQHCSVEVTQSWPLSLGSPLSDGTGRHHGQ